jgi:hypothetical protein
MPSKDVTKLEKKLEELESRLKSGVRSKRDEQNLRREIKKIKAELKAEYNLKGPKGNKLGYALDGETGEPGTTMPPKPPARKKDKPKLEKREGPSYSIVTGSVADDMTQDDYGLMEKVRIRDKAEEENIGEAAAEQNLKKGGAVTRKAKPSKYGMKHGGFTKRGGMYKKGMS